VGTRLQRLLVVALVGAAIGAGIAAALWSRGVVPGIDSSTVAQERPRIDGDFELLDVRGRIARWSELGNRLQLVFFGFTHCPEVCPVTMATAAEAIRNLGEPASDVRLLLISVDPDRDTPERMAEYTAPFQPQVVGLTGTPEQVATAAKTFHVMYEKMPPMDAGGDYMVNHTSSIFVLGPHNEILDIIPYGAKSVEIAAVLQRHL
jgi:protein SCO1/2